MVSTIFCVEWKLQELYALWNLEIYITLNFTNHRNLTTRVVSKLVSSSYLTILITICVDGAMSISYKTYVFCKFLEMSVTLKIDRTHKLCKSCFSLVHVHRETIFVIICLHNKTRNLWCAYGGLLWSFRWSSVLMQVCRVVTKFIWPIHFKRYALLSKFVGHTNFIKSLVHVHRETLFEVSWCHHIYIHTYYIHTYIHAYIHTYV